MKKVKLGIIGCGIAAKKLHLTALNRLKDKFEITALCNHTEKKAKEFSKLVGGAPYVLDYKELLKRPDVEAVDIVLPIYLNYPVTRDALKAGKYVIVEKPLGANLQQAKKMLELEKRYKQVKVLLENYFYKPTYLKAKKYIDEGKIGKPYSILWNKWTYFDKDNIYACTQWRKKNRHIGGFISDGGIHLIATLRMLFGELKLKSSFNNSVNPAIGNMDTFGLHFETQKGIDGMITLFFSANGCYDNQLYVFGTKGTMCIQGYNTIIIKKSGKPEYKEVVDDNGGHTAAFENFYNAIRNNQKIISTFSEGYKDLKTLIDAFSLE
ncbi:MAG: hypothetical protein A2551_04605 [Elusimicrobia bacterium RIFOXYD2_FULL_34_30]|nr:MAG: hypothetical protein A2551_04605 [Elusimicrobia bacterium RIFOXYD2_FULL_34_30]